LEDEERGIFTQKSTGESIAPPAKKLVGTKSSIRSLSPPREPRQSNNPSPIKDELSESEMILEEINNHYQRKSMATDGVGPS
jgi:hypothetical protein